MRITQQMVSQQFLRNIQGNNQAIGTIQGQISSGKKFEKVSDQPIEAIQGLSYRSSLMQVEQYQKNAQDGINWSTAMEDSLSNVTNVLQRARELTVQASSDSNNESDKKRISIEIRSLLQQVGDFANTTYGNDYLFSGTDRNTLPYQNGSLQQTSQDGMQWNIGQGQSVSVKVHATSVFGFSVEGKNLFETLDSIAQTLENGENPSSLLSSMDQHMDNVLTQRGVVASNQKLFELAANKLDQAQFLNEKMLSETEDTDIAKAFTELSLQETAYKASLTAGAKILQLSLADFLR